MFNKYIQHISSTNLSTKVDKFVDISKWPPKPPTLSIEKECVGLLTFVKYWHLQYDRY